MTLGRSEMGCPPPPTTEKHKPLEKKEQSRGAKGCGSGADLKAKMPCECSLGAQSEDKVLCLREGLSFLLGDWWEGGIRVPGARTVYRRALPWGPQTEAQPWGTERACLCIQPE